MNVGLGMAKDLEGLIKFFFVRSRRALLNYLRR
jgi:hypothetical protein